MTACVYRHRPAEWDGRMLRLLVTAVITTMMGLPTARAQAPQDTCDGQTLADRSARCDQGDPAACLQLGLSYAGGQCVAVDTARAAELFGRACEGGNGEACERLGVARTRGLELDRGPSAAQLFKQACDSGRPSACGRLKRICAEEASDRTARDTACPEPAQASLPTAPSHQPVVQVAPPRSSREADTIDPSANWTPRDGAVSGGFLGLELGAVSVSDRLETRTGLSGRVTYALRLGIAFVDQLIVQGAFGGFTFNDAHAFSTDVVDCQGSDPDTAVCDDDPHEAASTTTTTYLTAEAGYQYRLRSSWASLVPGVVLGYLGNTSEIVRGIMRCVDCPGEAVEGVDLSGGYLAPFVRFTFGGSGTFAISVRSQWALAGDLGHMLVFGLDVGEP
jgi:hypothetical protein